MSKILFISLVLCISSQVGGVDVKPGGDLICGTQGNSSTSRVLPLGYTHPIYLRSTTKLLAQQYLASNQQRSTWCIRTGPTGVLDPRGMWMWPDNEVPAVFEVYTMVVGELWHSGQLQCLNPHYSAWPNTHAYGLADDISPAGRSDIYIGDCFVAVPRDHEARSFYVNATTLERCNIELPPPYNPGTPLTYNWPQWRDILVNLTRCGVKIPMITEECMIAPLFGSFLQGQFPPIPIMLEDKRTCAWRGEAFVKGVFNVWWPPIQGAWLIDPTQAMVKQWINYNSPTMQRYMAKPIYEIPANQSTPLDRSECALATYLEGMSTHKQTSASEILWTNSPGIANSFQSWVWAKSSRPMSVELSKQADDWLAFISEYVDLNGDPTALFNYDLSKNRYPVYTSARNHPSFQALKASDTNVRIKTTLIDKGRILDFPGTHRKNTHMLESQGVITRFFADWIFKCGLTPSSTDSDVLQCIRMARDRAVVLIELYALPDCTIGTHTKFVPFGNGSERIMVYDPEMVNRTCFESYQSQVYLERYVNRREGIACTYPGDVIWRLDASCESASPDWDMSRVDRFCILIQNVSSLASVDAVKMDACPYIQQASALPWVVTVVMVVQLVLAALLYKYRKESPVKSGSLPWSMGVLASGFILVMSTALQVGPRTEENCLAFTIVAPLAATSLVACLFGKALRIYLIYTQKTLMVVKVRIMLYYMAATLISLLLAIVRLSVSDPFSATVPVLQAVQLRGFVAGVCNYTPAWYWGLQLTVICCLSVFTIGLTVMSKDASTEYLEKSTLFWIAVGLVLVIPITVLVIGLADGTSLALLSIMPVVLVFLVSSSSIVYMVPKIYRAYIRRLMKSADLKMSTGSSEEHKKGEAVNLASQVTWQIKSSTSPPKSKSAWPDGRGGSP